VTFGPGRPFGLIVVRNVTRTASHAPGLRWPDQAQRRDQTSGGQGFEGLLFLRVEHHSVGWGAQQHCHDAVTAGGRSTDLAVIAIDSHVQGRYG